MKIILMTIGKTADREMSPLIDRYIDRVRHMAPFEYRVLPDVKVPKNAGADRQKELEGVSLLSNIGAGDVVVLLDERGKMPTSRQFAVDLDHMMTNTQRNIFFIIGGAYGFSEAVYARANRMMGLSAMTLTHEMARLFMSEQIYRALTILRGMPYHHD